MEVGAVVLENTSENRPAPTASRAAGRRIPRHRPAPGAAARPVFASTEESDTDVHG